METKNKIASTTRKKLQECRVKLQKKKIKKSGKNNFAGFDYYELADFLPTINEMFMEQGLFSEFSIRNDIATLIISDMDNIEDAIMFESPIAEANIKGCTPIQSLGGIHTYMKRYLYINALEIVEHDMLDPKVGNMEVETQKKKPNVSKPITTGQINILMRMYDEPTIQRILYDNGVTNIDQLSMQVASDIIGRKIVY